MWRLNYGQKSAILAVIIVLADSFGRYVIAEGVEYTEQGLMLLIMGCYQAQGYGIARPMSASEIPVWLTHYKPNEEWINYAKSPKQPKEKELDLFKLILSQWINNIETVIQSSPEAIARWSGNVEEKSHCSYWIKRAKQRHLFDDSWLKQLNKAYKETDLIARDLLRSYQNGSIENARNGLPELHSTLNKINAVLEQAP